MDSSFIVVAKTVMENRQMIAALTYALSITNPELYTLYNEKLAEIKKSQEKDFAAMDNVLRQLNEKAARGGQDSSDE